ncbi:hypothetical protein L0F63_004464 [Massospora cicadina]|nr:hypothetical protein L0F63_004464 [Massospora cicadina]
MLFRSLHSGFLTLSKQTGFYVPYGSQLFFMLVATQVMYAFVLFPNTLPSSETKLMYKLSKIPENLFEINRKLLRGKEISSGEYLQMIPEELVSNNTREEILNYRRISTLIPCRSLHLSCDTCSQAVVDKFVSGFKLMLPAYAFVNFTSKLIFGLSSLMTNPQGELLKMFRKTLRSGIFLATFVGLYQLGICRVHNLAAYVKKPSHIHALYALAPFLASGMSAAIENPLRLQTLSMFLAPKALSSFYSILNSRKKLPRIPNFEAGLFSLSSGLIMVSWGIIY